MQRVHILGAAGSGKTTLAQQVAARLGAPCYDLDLVAYEGDAWRHRPLAQRQADLRHILVQPAWVTEGAYLWWVEDLLAAADVIIWLDLPWPIAFWRIVTRHLKLSWAGTNRHPGTLKLLGFLWYCRTYYLDRRVQRPQRLDDDRYFNRASVNHVLGPYREKVVRCQRPQAVGAWLAETMEQSARLV
jgi:adenylate kinase family enzyme